MRKWPVRLAYWVRSLWRPAPVVNIGDLTKQVLESRDAELAENVSKSNALLARLRAQVEQQTAE